MGRPVFTHEFPSIAEELKEKSKKDFMSIKVVEKEEPPEEELKEKSKKDFMSIKVVEKEEPPEWLYHTSKACYGDVDFDAVEKALGFRLFGWQKDYILSGCAYAGRRTGKTTAEILHQLLSVNEEPIDFSRPARDNQAYIFKMDCHDIWEKLRDAGIEMRPVFWSKEDKKKYQMKARTL